MKSFKRIKVLSNTVSELIEKNNLNDVVVADVGSDHGYLSELISRNLKVKKVFATDISKECLNKTIELKNNFNLSKIEPILCDGLSKIEACDVAVIAGMGGYEIIKILNYQNITKNKGVKCRYFVLQPSDNIVELREWLYSNKICILRDFVFESYRRFYDVILVDVLTKQENQKSLKNLYFGRDNFQLNSDYKNYLENKLKLLEFLDEIDLKKIEKDEQLKQKFELKKIIVEILGKK